MSDHVPPYFAVGKTYEDMKGMYTVIAIENGVMEIERPDRSREQSRDLKLKENIDRRISRERNGPHDTGYLRGSASNYASLYPKHDEAHPILGKLIENYCHRNRGYMDHEEMVEALLQDREAQAIIERIDDDKTPAGRAGVIIAGFTQTFSLGRSPWNDRFEGDKTKGKWRFKLRST